MSEGGRTPHAAISGGHDCHLLSVLPPPLRLASLRLLKTVSYPRLRSAESYICFCTFPDLVLACGRNCIRRLHLAHALALAASAGLPITYWIFIRNSGLGNVWTMFNVPDSYPMSFLAGQRELPILCVTPIIAASTTATGPSAANSYLGCSISRVLLREVGHLTSRDFWAGESKTCQRHLYLQICTCPYNCVYTQCSLRNT